MRKTGKINKIKRILLTIQKVLGKIASFGERIHYIFSWTDRIVTGVALFVAVVFVLLTTVLLNAGVAWARPMYALRCFASRGMLSSTRCKNGSRQASAIEKRDPAR